MAKAKRITAHLLCCAGSATGMNRDLLEDPGVPALPWQAAVTVDVLLNAEIPCDSPQKLIRSGKTTCL